MKLYNTLGRQVQEFKPLQPGKALMYSCGPTVYSFYHIGNLRNAVFNDTLRRTLIAAGYDLKNVMNITDVGHLTSDADEGQDKLEKGAAAEGKTVWEVADLYAEAFKNDMAALNVLPPNGYQGKKDNYARATDFIPQQIELVQRLLDKGYAYQTEQAIYFDVSKIRDYTALTGQNLDEKEVAARQEVVTDPQKHHPQDFAVWFFATGHFEGHSMRWPSPWGEGFPGWHLECSAIVHATLADPIDIHTGAVDLIGTHHTNERAQTKAAYGNGLANYWVHNEYVLVEGRKMSKSLGNIFTLGDLQAKGYAPAELRFLYLQSHYRSQMNFSWKALAAAKSRLQALQAWADLRWQPHKGIPGRAQDFADLQNNVQAALEDDLNTPAALAALSAVIDATEAVAESDLKAFTQLLNYLDDVLGLGLAASPDITGSQKEVITRRETARAAQDWTESDQLREQLAEQGIELKDTPYGSIWSRSGRPPVGSD